MKWLFLVHQVRTAESRERVKVWRMTKKVGAILYRNSVYVLPYGKDRLEDFQWLSQQIRGSNGDASVFVSEPQDETEDRTLRSLFERSKREEFNALLNSIEALSSSLRRSQTKSHSAAAVRTSMKELKRVRAECIAIQRTDFFHHPLSAEAESALKDAEEMMRAAAGPRRPALKPGTYSKKTFHGKAWSTRQHIHIDRLCSAWLIRRFIDRQAKFVFAPEGTIPRGTIPFDVMGAEFSHHGDNCSFETLLYAFQLNDPALKVIAQIVHDIDLKDQKFGRAEASGVDIIVRSLSDSLRDDRKVLEVGSILLDALYRRFAGKKKVS